jgi:hypothetical protein
MSFPLQMCPDDSGDLRNSPRYGLEARSIRLESRETWRRKDRVDAFAAQ